MKLKLIFLAGLVCAFSASLNARANESANMSEDELVQAAEKLIAEEKAQEQKQEIKAEEQSAAKNEVKAAISADKAESDIPAFRGKDAEKSASSSPWTRLFLGAGVVMTMAIGALFAAKRFGKRNNVQGSKKIHLDIVSQKAISPKQNLLVVRIAGEHILVGATDHSINMIKTVSLIDDEADNSLPQDFNNFLEDEFVEQSISSNKKTRTFTV